VEQDSPTQLLLTIRQRGKGVPYGCGPRDEGSINHGFKLLKGGRSTANDIPEAEGEPGLTRLIVALNEPRASFLSIGCEMALNHDEKQGHSKTGYIEFALDSLTLAADARHSFAVFFYFDEYLNRTRFNEPILFRCELEGNALVSNDKTFYSICCWIHTAFCPSAEIAVALWDKAADVLARFVREWNAQGNEDQSLSAILAADLERWSAR
jgi:hypothetical protein